MALITSIPSMYCPACHLSTRADIVRCLHCNKPLRPTPAKSRAGKKTRMRER